jgi:hypothetical protein
MTTKPATTAAEYAENTRDENKQRELHPQDTGSIDLDTFRALPLTEQRAAWALASDADRRGLILQTIRRGQHGPDDATIALYLSLYEAKFGLSEVETAIVGALSRLARESADSARTARAAHLTDDATFFQRAANAYAKALSFYVTGLRPTPIQDGWMLPSQRAGEPPHLLTLSGDWTCTCPAGESMHWAKALIIGIEAGYDDLARLGGDAASLPEDTDPDDFSDVGPERARLDDEANVRSLVSRLSAARAKRRAA